MHGSDSLGIPFICFLPSFFIIVGYQSQRVQTSAKAGHLLFSLHLSLIVCVALNCILVNCILQVFCGLFHFDLVPTVDFSDPGSCQSYSHNRELNGYILIFRDSEQSYSQKKRL